MLREFCGTFCQWLAVAGIFAIVGAGIATLELLTSCPKYLTYPLGFIVGAVPAWRAWTAVGRHWGLR